MRKFRKPKAVGRFKKPSDATATKRAAAKAAEADFVSKVRLRSPPPFPSTGAARTRNTHHAHFACACKGFHAPTSHHQQRVISTHRESNPCVLPATAAPSLRISFSLLVPSVALPCRALRLLATPSHFSFPLGFLAALFYFA
jgi:hypothetical protein